MEGVDNIMQILKSITPIRYKFSKKNKELDKTFKSMSLQNLIKTIDYHPKLHDEFYPAPEFLNNKNKYEVNFKNSEEYIKEFSDLNNLPLVISNRNCLKNGTFNPDYDMNHLDNKEEKKKIMEAKEQRKRERLEERLKRLKFWKESDSNIDWGKYHPNYDFIRKKITSVHIRPPTVKKIRKKETDEKNNKDNKKNIMKKNNIQNQSMITFGNNNINNNTLISNVNNNITNNAQIHGNNNLNEMSSNNNSTNNNNIITNREDEKISNTINNNNQNNNSLILNDSGSIRSNSPKFRYKDFNRYFSFRANSRNNIIEKEKILNLKNKLKVYDKNSSTISDYNTMEINKSTNIEDYSLIHQEKEKLSSVNSIRNISQKNNNLYLPNIYRKVKLRPLKKKKSGIKYSIYFKKMKGRDDSLFAQQSLNLISYFPNYDFLRPHVPTTIFKYKKDDDNYKKYITGKIIRGYKYSPEKYFVFEYKKNRKKKLNINQERKKIIEILKEKV